LESERKVDLDCVVCKHTDCVHPSGVGFREGGVYSTIISTAVGTVDYVQQYRSGTGIAVYPRYKIASLLKGRYGTAVYCTITGRSKAVSTRVVI
jgi:hypothetical protein